MAKVFSEAKEANHTDFNYDASVSGAGAWESALQALEGEYGDIERLYQAPWPS